MKFTVQGNTPFSAHICQYLYDLESNFAKEKLSLPLSQIIAHILYGTKRIRLGNEAIPSEAITILEECIEANQPIPIVSSAVLNRRKTMLTLLNFNLFKR